MTRVLKRCISLRLQASRRFAGDPDPANITHRYFTNVLIGVCRLLEHNSSKTDTKTEISSNQFSALSVNETEEDVEDVPDIQLPTVASSMPNAEFEPEMSPEEAVHAVIIFLEDLETTRLYIMNLWQDYKIHSLDLVTTSVITNTALELLKKPHDDLMQRVLPLFRNDLQVLMWAVFVVLRGQTTFNPAWDMPGFENVDHDDAELGRLYDFIMVPYTQMLDALGRMNDNRIDPIYKQKTAPIYKPGYYGHYDPDAAHSSRRARWAQCKILLAESFTDIFYLLNIGERKSDHTRSDSGREENVFTLDETMNLMDQFIKTNKLSLHLAFAMRMLVEINLTLGLDTARGHRHLKDSADNMIRCLESRPAIEGDVGPPSWDSRNEGVIRHFITEANFFAKDFDLRRLKKVKGLEHGPWQLVERDPLLCGLMLFRLQMRYQDIGFAISNSWASILYAAHLYEACRHSGTSPGTPTLPLWPDMDLVLQIHGKEHAFGGIVPTNLDDSNSAFETVAGASQEAVKASRLVFTHYVPPPRRQASKKLELYAESGAICFEDQTRILPIFKRKFTSAVASGLEYDINSIDGLLRDIRIDQDRDLVLPPKSTKSGRRGFRKEKKHRAAKYSLVQILSVLEEGLRIETTSIRFDYVSMHLRCLSLFRNIKTVSHDYLLGKMGPEYLENDSQLPWMTGWILRFAALGFRQYAQMSGRKLDKSIAKSRLLMGATDEIRKLLKKEDEGQKESFKVEHDRIR